MRYGQSGHTGRRLAMDEPVATKSGRHHAHGMAQYLARGAATGLGGASESSRNLVRTGVPQAQCATRSPLRRGSLGTPDGQAVRNGIHLAVPRATENIMRKDSRHLVYAPPLSNLRGRERKEGSVDAQTLRWTRLIQESRISLFLHHPYMGSALRKTIGV